MEHGHRYDSICGDNGAICGSCQIKSISDKEKLHALEKLAINMVGWLPDGDFRIDFRNRINKIIEK